MRTRFSDRSPVKLAALSLVLLIVSLGAALNFTKLPIFNHTRTYSAYFANTAGLVSQDVVAIDGVKVGVIKHLALAGPCRGTSDQVSGCVVKVIFTVNNSIRLGVDTNAYGKVQTPLGTEYLQLTPAGPGRLAGPIPLSKTHVPYTLVGDLYQLTQQVQNYNIPNLVKALKTTSATLNGTPAGEVATALSGLARFSQILAANHDQLATIVTQGSQLTAILNQRSAELVSLVGQGDIILRVLQTRQATIKQILDGTAALSAQLTSLLGNNRTQWNSLFTNLSTVATVLSKDSADIGAALPVLAAFSRYAANVTGSGPFADVSIPTLLIPDNVIKQCGAPGAFPSSNPLVGCRP
jgi:phospholipid/cholesterol/gamma-HCH transport system substrate-binding protein